MVKKFTGEGFSNKSLTGVEASKHRHMFNEVQESWETLNNIAIIGKGARVMSMIIKSAIPLGMIAIIAGFLVNYFGLI